MTRLAPAWPAATAAAILFALASALWSAWDQGWTYDEAFHLQWSGRLAFSGIDERESQERFNSKTPIMLPGALLQRAALSLGSSDPRVARFAARLPTVFWLASLLLAVFVFARRLAGRTAAHLATIATALDPNLIAHGSLATADVPYALATLLALWALIRVAEAPSALRGAALGAALGFAFAAKFTAFLLVPALLLGPLAAPSAKGRWRRMLVPAFVAIALAAVVVCAAYLFQGVGTPLSSLTWHSRLFTSLAGALPRLRLPLPRAFWTGVDISLAGERAEWNVYLLGRLYPHGVPYYFALLWLLKTPLGLLLPTAFGLARVGPLLPASPALRFLALNLVLSLAYFSFLFHAQIGYRFVLMCVPLAYLLAAAGLASLRPTSGLRATGAALFLLALLEDAFYFGNPLAFTNAAVQPKREVFRIMADSNVDWGQNRERIGRWLAEDRATGTRLDPLHVMPGHNTIDLNTLAGIWDFERYRWLRDNADPAGHYGHTYLWFDVDAALFDRFLSEQRRLAPDPAAARSCPPEADFEPLPAGSRKGFEASGPPGQIKTWVVCVATRKVADFALQSADGSLTFGPRRGSGCDAQLVGEGQVAWYRLDPGLHAFCAEEVPNRRPWIPRAFAGSFVVRGHAAGLAVREVLNPHPQPLSLPGRGEFSLKRRGEFSGPQDLDLRQ